MEKPTWDELFITEAVLGSSRGTCDRLRAACFLVKNKRIVGAGYNGSMANTPTCDEVGHDILNDHCVRTLHAEQNALANSWGDLRGATAYITATPCLNCIKELGQKGISRIVYAGHYDNKDDGRIYEYCRQGKIELVSFADDPKNIALVFKKIFDRLQGPGGIFKKLEDLKNLIFTDGATIKTMTKGKLVIFEGPEKSGKSTQIERTAGYLVGGGYQVLTTKEPGGGIADLRKKIMALDPKDPELPQKELALFEEDRAEHYSKVVIPALKRDAIVLCDRGPASTKAYQGYGRGVDLQAIAVANAKVTQGVAADLTILFDISPEEILRRIKKDGETKVTRFEKEPREFHEKVRQGFLAQAKEDPEHWLVLDGIMSKEVLALAIQKALKEKLGF